MSGRVRFILLIVGILLLFGAGFLIGRKTAHPEAPVPQVDTITIRDTIVDYKPQEAAIPAGFKLISISQIEDYEKTIAEFQDSLNAKPTLVAIRDTTFIAVPMTDKTRGMCDASFFAKMKDRAIFINAARGLEVDEPALVAALKSGKLWGAGLDCYSEEPLPLSNALYGLENVVMTPHNASATEDSFMRCSMDMGYNVMDVMLDHKKPRYAVNNPPQPRLG